MYVYMNIMRSFHAVAKVNLLSGNGNEKIALVCTYVSTYVSVGIYRYIQY